MTDTWFGTSWGAGICSEDNNHVATPVGQVCGWCDEPILAGDSGIIMPHVYGHGAVLRPLHVECNVRSIGGSLGHRLRRCSCYGGTEEDPPGMTKREAARAVWEMG